VPTNVMTPTLNSDKLPVAQLLLNSFLFVTVRRSAKQQSCYSEHKTHFTSYSSSNNLLTICV